MTNEPRVSARPARVFALIVGCLLLLPALGALLGGAGLGLGYAFGRDDSGFFETDLDRIESPTVAVTTQQVDFAADPGTPSWVIDALDADVRLRVANQSSDQAVFVGIGPSADVDRYLSGVAHDEIRELDGRAPEYRSRSGSDEVTAPAAEDFWVASATGVGSQELVWPATGGQWAAVVMNADGAPGVSADVNVGVKTDFVLPLALTLLALGAVGTAGSVALIVYGAHGLGRAGAATSPDAPSVGRESSAGAVTPVRVEAHLDPGLSRWQWLVKWFLAIPHFIVLLFLWLAFVVLTVVAGFSILFTGRYPRGIFGFNVGVMRWSWRVSFYATTGGIGTDRYPPFSLHPDPSYPASLDVEAPGELSRGLVLVKWWLLAIPHYVIIGILVGGSLWTLGDDAAGVGPAGLLNVLVVVAGVILLFRNRYPVPLFDLIVGLNRWIFRVVAYAALMTDRYPPFRLDQGPTEPTPPPTGVVGD